MPASRPQGRRSSGPPMVRTFVAVFPPEEVRLRLGEEVARLRRQAGDAKWVGPDNFHFTLRFLGGLPEEKLDLVTHCVAESIRAESPFELKLTGLGAFPNARRPRVLWVGTDEGGERLSRVAKLVEFGLRGGRFGKADKRFSPHLTIARWRRPQRGDAVERLIAASLIEIGPFTVDAVRVMESRLRPEGPEYIVRAACALEG